MDVECVEKTEQLGPCFSTSLAAGAAAGMSVDMLFYPIDTIKTRLQSAQGFWKAGGFSGVYRGMGSVAVGSAPGASIFFVTYESMKAYLSRTIFGAGARDAQTTSPLVHMSSASMAEVAACLVRVPTEVVKSRQQTSTYGRIASSTAFREVLGQEGVAGLYRGFGGTILREVRADLIEIPFTCVQFPLYEYLKRRVAGRNQEPTWWQAAGAGSVAGSVAAAVTTPLDVVKTRIMLAKVGPHATDCQAHARDAPVDTRILATLRRVLDQGGARALFSGVVPRTLWIGLGGAVFLGSFDAAAKLLEPSAFR